MSRVALFADISPNIIDGSSIWMVSITEVLSYIYDEVVLILREPVENDRLLSALSKRDNIVVDEPIRDQREDTSGPRSVKDAAERARELIVNGGLDAIVVRGLDSCNEFCQVATVSRILWSYVTDLPFPPSRISANGKNRLERVARRSKGLFAQTESARSYFEALAPSATGKTYLLPPMIPDYAYASTSDSVARLGTDEDPVRIIYAGKFAEQWRTLELLDLPERLADRGIKSVLTVIGGKINKSPRNPTWRSEMQKALNSARSVNSDSLRILGELPRRASLSEIAKSHFGIGWRTAELDSGLEISTKALEYAAAGAVPIINKNEDHTALFGDEYPFFCTPGFQTGDLADLIANNLSRHEEAKKLAARAAQDYSMGSAVRRLSHIFKRAGALKEKKQVTNKHPTKLVIASHDLKFCGEILYALQADDSFEVRIDHWESLHHHDSTKSSELANWADVVLCEFAGPNLQFYSHAVPDRVNLVSRLHGFEVRNRAPWLTSVDFGRVNSIVTVSDYYRQLTEKLHPEALGRVTVIPNMVDTHIFSRPKHNFAKYHLGIIGIVPFLKRPDRALDLMEALLSRSSEFYLHVKGHMPWDYGYVWRDKIQYQQYIDFFQRATTTPLSDHVIFEPFSTDIASWYRGIGYCLSPSSHESFHLAPAEGMASGAIPIVWDRPGSIEVFGKDHVYDNVQEMADKILRLSSGVEFRDESKTVTAYAQRWDTELVMQHWFDLLRKRDAS